MVKGGEPGGIAGGVEAREEVKDGGFIGGSGEVRGERGLGGLELGFGVGGVIRRGWEGGSGHGDLEEASLAFQRRADFWLAGFMRARSEREKGLCWRDLCLG